MTDRVTDLEIKLAYLEDANQALDELVRQLFNRVDRLDVEVKRIKEERDGGWRESVPPPGEKPPHY